MLYLLDVAVIFLGLIFGSFINCLVWRLYNNESIMGRSYCPKCRAQIHFYDNIPILSFLFLRGKCRACDQKISWQYPIVEAVSGLLFFLAFYQYLNAQLAVGLNLFDLINSLSFWLVIAKRWLAIIIFLAIFIHDGRWYEIPLNLIIVAGVLFLGLNLLLGYNFWTMILVGATGAAFFALQFIITRGRGLGEGDIWIGGLMGLMFAEIGQLAIALFIAYVFGALISVGLLASGKKKMKSALPLGVFLAIGTLVTIIWSSEIITAFLSI